MKNLEKGKKIYNLGKYSTIFSLPISKNSSSIISTTDFKIQMFASYTSKSKI